MKILFVVINFLFFLPAFSQIKSQTYIEKVTTINSKNNTLIIKHVENLNIESKEKLIPNDSNFIARLDSPYFHISPKQGVWYEPFFAYPINDSLTDGRIWSEGYNQIYNSFDLVKFGDKEINVKRLMSISSGPATANKGSTFMFSRLPSFILFGDFSDKSKYYIATFK